MKTIFFSLLLLYTPLMANTDLQQQRSQRIESIFNGLNKDTMHLVGEFYDANVEFQDPVGKIKGAEGIRKYYENMYKNVSAINFVFTKEVIDQDTHVVFWTMHLIAKGLNSGKPVSVDGNSHITFGGNDGKAIYHRDYFDMGEFIYEHIPVLGFVVKKVKSQLEHK